MPFNWILEDSSRHPCIRLNMKFICPTWPKQWEHLNYRHFKYYYYRSWQKIIILEHTDYMLHRQRILCKCTSCVLQTHTKKFVCRQTFSSTKKKCLHWKFNILANVTLHLCLSTFISNLVCRNTMFFHQKVIWDVLS